MKGFANEDRSPKDKKIPGGTGLFRPLWERKKKLPPVEVPAPHVALQAIEAEMDYVAPWPPADWQAEVGEIADNDSSADRLLALWMDCLLYTSPSPRDRG